MAACAAITIVPPHPPLAHTRSLCRTSFAASARVARITDMQGATDRIVPSRYAAPAPTRLFALRGVEPRDRARLRRTLPLDRAALPHSRTLNAMKPGLRGWTTRDVRNASRGIYGAKLHDPVPSSHAVSLWNPPETMAGNPRIGGLTPPVTHGQAIADPPRRSRPRQAPVRFAWPGGLDRRSLRIVSAGRMRRAGSSNHARETRHRPETRTTLHVCVQTDRYDDEPTCRIAAKSETLFSDNSHCFHAVMTICQNAFMRE